MLSWSGIVWEEGPHSNYSKQSEGNLDGPYGPYIQSLRLGIYKEYIKILLEVTKNLD